MHTSEEDVVKEPTETEGKLQGLENESEAKYESNFAYLYKAANVPTQEERRQRHLELLRSRRNNIVDEMRKLKDILSEEFDDCFGLNIDWEELIPFTELTKTNSATIIEKKRFRLSVMLSEWLTEKPEDLKDNWLVKLCPEGKRRLIIAHEGITKAYNLGGAFMGQFQSALPGGNELSNRSKFTVLDCVFNLESQCYFVIDLLAWNGISMRLGDVECRYFWIQSKLDEYSKELQTVTTYVNDYPFYKIEMHPTDSLSELLSIYPYRFNNDASVSLDGILFYRKDVPYIKRYTPLVGWLKPYMVEEILGIHVNECFKPPDAYTTMANYLATKMQQKKKSNESVEQN